MRLPPLPTFLIVGAQKSATRWLRAALGRHPEVHTAERELEFFDHHLDEGTLWYRRRFEGWDGEPVVGEATPGYLFHRNDPLVISGRIRAVLGADVRIVAILREPVARARSAYIHHLRNGNLDPDLDPLEHFAALDPLTDPLGLVTGGWYGRSLLPYLDRFGPGVHVEFHEDAHREPEALVARVLAHVGASPSIVPDGLREVTNAGAEQAAERFGGHRALTLTDDELRPVIGHHFVDDVVLLESLLGRPTPWGDVGSAQPATGGADAGPASVSAR